MAQTFVSAVAHFFVVVGGSKFHERLAHFFIDIYIRLPFPVPDPIINYKSSIAEDPLMEVQVPEMITKLKQGIGRLIRNYSDTGIVSIIDPRLNDERLARYRDVTWDSLPIKNRTSSIQKLAAFYSQLQKKT